MSGIDAWWIAIGIFSGMFFGIVFIGIGFIAGVKDGTDKGHNQDKLPNDNTDGDLLHVRSGDRSSDNRRNTPHTVEEKIMVLNTFRTGSTIFEKSVLDEISDDLIELDAKKFIQEHEKDCIEAAIEDYEEQAEKIKNPKPIWRFKNGQQCVSLDGGETWEWCYETDDLVRLCPMGYNPFQE